jgi:hypothetical protein
VRVFEVVPHVGIGPLRLGMTPAEVRRAAAGHPVEAVGRGREEMVTGLGLTTDSAAGGGPVTFIQAFPAEGVRFTLWGADVFATPAAELVAAVVSREGLAAADFPPGQDEYQFPSLGLVLWRRGGDRQQVDEVGVLLGVEPGRAHAAAATEVPLAHRGRRERRRPP